LKEIEEGLPQNVRRMTRLGLILAWKISRLEAGTSLFDLIQWAIYRAKHGD
jgi:hypothetical protein